MMHSSRIGTPPEGENEHLLLAYTNEDIHDDENYRAWWGREFDDLQWIAGLSDASRFFADPNQRAGQVPRWKYLVVHGFTGDAAELRRRVQVHAMSSDSALWLYDAIGDFVRKSDRIVGSRPRSLADDAASEPTGPEHVFMALTNVKPGREADFHEWYDRYHVPDVVSVSCYQSGRRFNISATSGAAAPWEYLAFYRFCGSVPEMHKTLEEDMMRGETVMSDAFADDDGAWIYTPV